MWHFVARHSISFNGARLTKLAPNCVKSARVTAAQPAAKSSRPIDRLIQETFPIFGSSPPKNNNTLPSCPSLIIVAVIVVVATLSTLYLSTSTFTVFIAIVVFVVVIVVTVVVTDVVVYLRPPENAVAFKMKPSIEGLFHGLEKE